jgi:hypothetical protein
MKVLFTTLALPPLVSALVFSAALQGSIGTAQAGETVVEKAQATGNDAARAVKKATHRVEEATCVESDVKCLQEKAQHRLQEAGEYTKDKASEIKNELDDDAGE